MLAHDPEILALLLSAAGIAFTHTLMGPDHYLPFVSIACARGWNWRRLLLVTLLCGAAHLAGSVLLGLLGIGLQARLAGLVAIESWRGDLAAWLLFSSGLVYLAWGIRYAGRGHVHRHNNTHPQWLIFIVFILGPCEPLIPLLMYPAAASSAGAVLLVTLVFGLVTMATMLLAVAGSYAGLQKIRLRGLERYGHAVAGATLTACGASILFLGL